MTPQIGINDNIRVIAFACIGIALMNFVFLPNNISDAISNTCTIISVDMNVVIYVFYLPIIFLLMYSFLTIHAGSSAVPNNSPTSMHLSDGTISYILNIPMS